MHTGVFVDDIQDAQHTDLNMYQAPPPLITPRNGSQKFKEEPRGSVAPWSGKGR